MKVVSKERGPPPRKNHAMGTGGGGPLLGSKPWWVESVLEILGASAVGYYNPYDGDRSKSFYFPLRLHVG